MKKRVLILLTGLAISSAAFAQKDEMKVLKRIYDKEKITEKDVAEYKATAAKLDSYISSASEADRIYMNYMKVQVPTIEMNALLEKSENQTPQAMANIMMKTFTIKNLQDIGQAYYDVLQHEKKTGKNVYTKDIQEEYAAVAPMLQQYVEGLAKSNNYKDAAKVLYAMYQLNPSSGDMLFNAATYAVAGQDYDAALNYYNELKKINYSGEGTLYIARNNANDTDESFTNREDRDKMVRQLKTHSNPREEKVPSKRGEIYKNIALILVEKGKVEEAKAAIAEAKRENPEDTSLLLTEADLYLTLKDTDTYKKLINQVLDKNPNDADLVYNLGVINLQSNNLTEAEKYFKRAIEINPNYINAYINLSAVKLKGDQKIVDEMNKLGTSDKDNKRYDVLKKQRTTLFNEVLPYLEKAHSIDAANQGVIDSLIEVYGFLEMTDKLKAVKAKRK